MLNYQQQPMTQQPMPQQPMPQQPMPQQPMPQQQPMSDQVERFVLKNQCWVNSNETPVKNYDTPGTPRVPQQQDDQSSTKGNYDFILIGVRILIQCIKMILNKLWNLR